MPFKTKVFGKTSPTTLKYGNNNATGHYVTDNLNYAICRERRYSETSNKETGMFCRYCKAKFLKSFNQDTDDW